MISTQIVQFEDITVKSPSLKVCVDGREIHFTLQELRLLLVFLSDPYRAFSREELIRLADLTNAGALHVLINRVRDLLGQCYIVSVRGHGYTFAVRGRLRTRKGA